MSQVNFFQRYNVPLARLAIFVVYCWFGALKVFNLSPASALVRALFDQTMPSFVPFGTFYLIFAGAEIIIGFSFLFKKTTRLGLVLIFLHLITTALPLVLLPQMVWTAFLVPTLEGQYIIKNILILAAAFTVGASLTPLAKTAEIK